MKTAGLHLRNLWFPKCSALTGGSEWQEDVLPATAAAAAFPTLKAVWRGTS